MNKEEFIENWLLDFKHSPISKNILRKKMNEDLDLLLNKWIKCSDELPKEKGSGYVLIYSDKIRVAFFEPIYSQFIVDAIGVLDDVTHWQHIEPPKGD